MIVVRHTITTHLSYSPNSLLLHNPGGKPYHNPGTHHLIFYAYKSRYPSRSSTISKSLTKGGPQASHPNLSLPSSILFGVIMFTVDYMGYSRSYTVPIDLQPAPSGATPHQLHNPIIRISNAKSRRPLHSTLPHLPLTSRLYTAPRQTPVQQYFSPTHLLHSAVGMVPSILHARSFLRSHKPAIHSTLYYPLCIFYFHY